MEIGERVRARIREILPGRTHASVAESVGMTPDAFSRAVNGSRGFSALELAALSDVLETSMYWLATGEQDPNEALIVARHTFDHETLERRADWDELTATVDQVVLAYRQAGLEGASIDVPGDASAARAALGEDFVRTFAERLAEVYHVDVVRLNGVKNACSRTIAGRVVIVLNETGNWFHQNWSLAHELGHVALGHANIPASAEGVNGQEAAANAFAADLLMPRPVLERVDWTTATGVDVARLLWAWGVSTDALRRRLSALRLPVSDRMNEILTWPTQRVLRRFPEWNDAGTDQITERMEAAAARRFPVELQTAHIERISDGRVPKATLAWMLGVDESEVEVDQPELPEPDGDELARALGFATS